MHPLTTTFVNRLRARDERAWFELWEDFGPVIRGQLFRWARGTVGAETVRDLTQETLAAVSNSIDRYDPARGARFSTWLLAIARHALGDELDRRFAAKRGGGRRTGSLEEHHGARSDALAPDAAFEQAMFRAKVMAALRRVERESEMLPFEAFRQRVLEGANGREVGQRLGTSEATVSRQVAAVRQRLRQRLAETMVMYSFTEQEQGEAVRAGLGEDDRLFDEAIGEIHRLEHLATRRRERRDEE
jgi:RNA polymerase sigma factor (sigma-70 family)